MSDLKKYIEKRKKIDKDFFLNFDEGYQAFKIGVILTFPHKNNYEISPQAKK